MSQFPPAGYYDPTAMPEPRRTSGLAVTALVTSLVSIIPCCAIVSPIGILLGLVGLVAISPPKKGKGLCVAAVIIGAISLAVYGYLAYWSYREFWIPFRDHPQQAFTKGFAGDPAGFRSHFYGQAAAASDADVNEFIDELRTRYGALQSVTIDQGSGGAQPQFGQPEAPFPYVLNFANATGVRGEATWVIADQAAGGQIIMKMRSFTIFDTTNGDVTFPAAQASANGASSATTGPDAGDGELDDGSVPADGSLDE